MPLPKIDSKKFTVISNDWGALFPEYKRKVKGGFNKIVSPFRFSVYVIIFSGSEGYRSFSCISPFLIETDTMGAHLTTETNRYGFLGWQGHALRQLYKIAAQSLRDDTPFPLEGPVTASQILKAYECSAGNRGFYIEDIESPALLCGWCGKPELALPWIEWGREKYIGLYERKLQRREALKGTISF